jgi:hypothetical protein
LLLPVNVRESQFNAYILDLEKPSVSGTVVSNSFGKAGWGFGFAGILPLPPLPAAFAYTEKEGCASLGPAIHNFIVSKEEPPTIEPPTIMDYTGADTVKNEKDDQKEGSSGNLGAEAP